MNNNWHNVSWEEAVKILDSNAEQGLTDEKAFLRQKKFGKNQLPEEKPLSRVKIFFGQLKSSLIYILIIAGFITLIFREWADSIVIFGAVALNTVVGFFQEDKTNQALRALKKIVRVKAQVIREGNEIEVDSEDLVPGDIIVLTAGNKVPADGRLIEVHHLRANEASLTGEWLAAQKIQDVLPEDTPLADRDNMVYMGCVVENGKGRAVITAIGKNTEMGKVAKMVKEIREEKTPYQKKVIHLSRTIGILIVFISFLIFVLGIAAGQELFQMFLTAVAVAVAAIPEGLPVALTVILALGMQRILKRKGLVRKLVAAEVLGSTSIIATDKTLTLTEGKMKVFETATPGTRIKFDEFITRHPKDQVLLVQIVVLTSEAFIENPDEAYPLWIIRGRSTDKALILAGAEVGLKKPILDKVYAKIDEIPFSSENKFIATLVQARPVMDGIPPKETKISFIRDPIIQGTNQAILVSGAPEKILNHSSFLHQNGEARPMGERNFSELTKELEDMAGKGLRIVAAAYKKIADHKTEIKNLEEEIKDLTFVGFIGLRDPLRPEAKEAIMLCKKAGMKPIIVTGDHLLTAKAVGEELELKTQKKNILEGQELDKMSDEEFRERVKDIEIYARVEPRHKLRIVEAWQKQGQVVAMTGDGINDAPALKKADIGVALGSGTDVAKEVSDLVLLTDNFNIIAAAVEEGRVIIDNIRKTVTLLVSQCFSEIILIAGSIIAGLPLPILPTQILWENLIEGSPQGVALAFEPKEKGVMERKPEDPKSPLLTQQMKVIIFGFGIITDIILFGLFLWLLRIGLPIGEIRTIIFAALAIDTLFYAFSCKNLRKNLWQYNPFSNLYLIGCMVFSLLMLLVAVYLPPFQILLKTTSLSLFDWLLLLGLGVINLILIEATKWYFIIIRKKETL